MEVPYDILLEIERLKIQQARLESHIKSESGTIEREATRLRDEIKKVETDVRHIIYGNGNTGMIIEIDRLKQFKKAVYWLGGIVGAELVFKVFEFVTK